MTDHDDISLIVAFGTDMGNAEDAAMTFAEAAGAIGVDAEAVELNQVDLADLRSATHFIVVTSTFGDGEFPDDAVLFWESLSADPNRLDHLSFAVLALGDSSYEFFCRAGRLLDERLELLGATRIADRVDVDGYDQQPAAAWTSDVIKVLHAQQTGSAAARAHPEPTRRERHHPAEARLSYRRLLTAPASDKEVCHYEVDLSGSGIAYRAGDSLAVHAHNAPSLVAALLTRLGVGPDYRMADHDPTLGILLTEYLEIRTPSRALQSLVASRTDDPHAAAALGDEHDNGPGSWVYGKDVLDLLDVAELSVDEVVDTMRPLMFRDYSIASSPLVHPDHAHLTVATVRYTMGNRRHGGVASTFLADRGGMLRVHLRPNHDFRLPADDVPIVMIGPGTGIAPFRAFLQERRATGASGRSWLFFGDRRRTTDFLYGAELQDFVASRTLTRLNLAFSRDGTAGTDGTDGTDGPKDYVQQHMWDNASDLFGWLQDGAHLYVCGDGKRMAKDVDATLRRVVATCGRMTDEAAHTYVNEMIRSHRYVRDVY